MELKQLKTSEVKNLREKLHKEQNEICPICKEKIEYSDTTLDHQHKLFKDQEIGENGAGLCRGVICRNCNSWEGKITNSYRRLGLHKKDISLPELLRNLADYLDQDNLPYIHPTEKPKDKKLKKSSYNKLVKELKNSEYRKKIPVFPKSGKLTKELEKLFTEFSIQTEFYK